MPFVASTIWIDICQSNGNLLATGGGDQNVKIFDKRESKIVKTFDGIHSSKILWFVKLFQTCNYNFLDGIACVRWNPSGNMLATASLDKSVKLLEFQTGKVLYTGTTSDGSNFLYIYIHSPNLMIRHGPFHLLYLDKDKVQGNERII